MKPNSIGLMLCFLVTLSVFIAKNEDGCSAQTISPNGIISATGELCYSAKGSCRDGMGIPGQMVQLNCSNVEGVSSMVEIAITDVHGSFNITLDGKQLVPKSCTMAVGLQLPAQVCPQHPDEEEPNEGVYILIMDIVDVSFQIAFDFSPKNK